MKWHIISISEARKLPAETAVMGFVRVYYADYAKRWVRELNAGAKAEDVQLEDRAYAGYVGTYMRPVADYWPGGERYERGATEDNCALLAPLLNEAILEFLP
jgi:hypothetical protein